ncbi:MAG: CvpA family protein [Firmicutes bacterium]|nr:CvpA family protein [Bacillota bacterium]
MNIVDLIIIGVIVFGAVLGFKRGFTRSLVSAVGFIVITVLAFFLKNPISVFLYENLPFFKFAGIIKGVTVLNIILYEVLAFVIVLAVLGILLKVLMLATSIFEKILNATIILGIPSKILGAIVGAIQYFVIAFVVLYIISLPVFNIKEVNESKYKDNILNNTPVLSDFVDDTVVVVEEFSSIKDKYKDNNNDTEQFNKEVLQLLLKYNIVKVESIDKLVEKEKIQINNIEEVLMPYRKDS